MIPLLWILNGKPILAETPHLQIRVRLKINTGTGEEVFTCGRSSGQRKRSWMSAVLEKIDTACGAVSGEAFWVS